MNTKNRYVGTVRLAHQGTIIDTAVVKTKASKGKDFFLVQVKNTLVEILKVAVDKYGDDEILDVYYQGDYGETVSGELCGSGAKKMRQVKGKLLGV